MFPDLAAHHNHLEHLLKTPLRAESLFTQFWTGPRNLSEISLKLILLRKFGSHGGPSPPPSGLIGGCVGLLASSRPACTVSLHASPLFKTFPWLPTALRIKAYPTGCPYNQASALPMPSFSRPLHRCWLGTFIPASAPLQWLIPHPYILSACSLFFPIRLSSIG